MSEEIKEALDIEGSVTMTLQDYNFMRDTLDSVMRTTDTTKEFLKKFNLSLAVIIGKAKEAGIDMVQLFDYFKDPEFKLIEEVKVVRANKEENKNNPRWVVIIKTVKDEEHFTHND